MQTDHEKLKQFLADFDENIVVADNLSHAFYGVAHGTNGYCAVYSTEKIITHRMEQDMMDFDTAEEFMNFNIINAYKGDNAPIFIDIIPEEFWK